MLHRVRDNHADPIIKITLWVFSLYLEGHRHPIHDARTGRIQPADEAEQVNRYFVY